jgi:hypothetical protein
VATTPAGVLIDAAKHKRATVVAAGVRTAAKIITACTCLHLLYRHRPERSADPAKHRGCGKPFVSGIHSPRIRLPNTVSGARCAVDGSADHPGQIPLSTRHQHPLVWCHVRAP